MAIGEVDSSGRFLNRNNISQRVRQQNQRWGMRTRATGSRMLLSDTGAAETVKDVAIAQRATNLNRMVIIEEKSCRK
jgi:hypothetical protein